MKTILPLYGMPFVAVQCKCKNTQTKQKKNNWKKNLKFSENGPLLSRTQPSWTMTT